MSGASRAAPAAVPEPGSGRTASRPAAEPPAELLRQAAIIAHDINNLLTAIGAAAEALKVATSEQDVAQCHADIRAAIAAGAALGRELAELGRKRRPFRRVRIEPALHQVAPVLRRLCGSDVVLVMDVEPGAGSARLDRTGLDRALVNLVRNAAAAMPRGGTVTVRGYTVTLDVTLQRRPDPIPPGSYVVVEVEDTGIGIPQHRQAWVLEPHATTRAESGNTGLGLAMVRDLARGCGGFLVLESAVGQFTRVGLYFPRL